VDWKIEKNEGSGRSTERTTEAVDAVKKIMENEWKTSFRHVFQQVCGNVPHNIYKGFTFISLPQEFCSQTVGDPAQDFNFGIMG
jgi:hypothetical protein